MSMHWLSDQLQQLTEIPSRSHEALLRQIEALITQLGERDEVTTAFASHDGLLCAISGEDTAVEALAAMSQYCMAPAHEAGRLLGMGAVRQQLIIGDHQKLVLFQLQDLVIGMLCPRDVDLASALQHQG